MHTNEPKTTHGSFVRLIKNNYPHNSRDTQAASVACEMDTINGVEPKTNQLKSPTEN